MQLSWKHSNVKENMHFLELRFRTALCGWILQNDGKGMHCKTYEELLVAENLILMKIWAAAHKNFIIMVEELWTLFLLTQLTVAHLFVVDEWLLQ